MKHHNIDPYPVPKDMSPRYINEPSLIDKSLLEYSDLDKVDTEPDNVRIYIPMDLNKEAILRRLDYIIAQYEEANDVVNDQDRYKRMRDSIRVNRCDVME